MATTRELNKPIRINWKVVAGDASTMHWIQMHDICFTTDDLRFYTNL